MSNGFLKPKPCTFVIISLRPTALIAFLFSLKMKSKLIYHCPEMFSSNNVAIPWPISYEAFFAKRSHDTENVVLIKLAQLLPDINTGP